MYLYILAMDALGALSSGHLPTAPPQRSPASLGPRPCSFGRWVRAAAELAVADEARVRQGAQEGLLQREAVQPRDPLARRPVAAAHCEVLATQGTEQSAPSVTAQGQQQQQQRPQLAG